MNTNEISSLEDKNKYLAKRLGELELSNQTLKANYEALQKRKESDAKVITEAAEEILHLKASLKDSDDVIEGLEGEVCLLETLIGDAHNRNESYERTIDHLKEERTTAYNLKAVHEQAWKQLKKGTVRYKIVISVLIVLVMTALAV